MVEGLVVEPDFDLVGFHPADVEHAVEPEVIPRADVAYVEAGLQRHVHQVIPLAGTGHITKEPGRDGLLGEIICCEPHSRESHDVIHGTTAGSRAEVVYGDRNIELLQDVQRRAHTTAI